MSTETSTGDTFWTITINPILASCGSFEIRIQKDRLVDDLRRVVGDRLKLDPDRIRLLYNERILSGGTLEANQLFNNCRLQLVLSIESGFASQKVTRSPAAVQTLDDISLSQVEAFLSGRLPLSFGIRLGDNLMLVQLQLSAAVAQQQQNRQRKLREQQQKCHEGNNTSPSDKMAEALSQSCSSNGFSASVQNPPDRSTLTLSDISNSAANACLTQDGGSRTSPSPLLERSSSPVVRLMTKSLLTPNVIVESPEERLQHRSGGPSQEFLSRLRLSGRGTLCAGTFSGILNSNIRGIDGVIKRDKATVLHILNDLLKGARLQRHNFDHNSNHHHHHHPHRTQRSCAGSRLRGPVTTGDHVGFNQQTAPSIGSPTSNDDKIRRAQENQTIHDKMTALQTKLKERCAKMSERRNAAYRSAPYPTIKNKTTDFKEGRDIHRTPMNLPADVRELPAALSSNKLSDEFMQKEATETEFMQETHMTA